MKLLQIVYVSTLAGEDKTLVPGILADCVRNNDKNELTGMLLINGSQFMQAIEGPGDAVLRTYQRVHLDVRHTQLIELLHTPVEERDFEAWSMGFRKLKERDASDFPDLAPYFQYGFDTNKIQGTPGAALTLLRHFAGLQQ